MKYTKLGLKIRHYPDDKWLNDLLNYQQVNILRAKHGQDKVHTGSEKILYVKPILNFYGDCLDLELEKEYKILSLKAVTCLL